MERFTLNALCLLAAGATLAACHPSSAVDLANSTYQGIESTPVTLVDGLWEGQPYVEGAASRPRVGLADTLDLRGDLDGDGHEETVVLLWHSTGGSGTFDYLAVMARRNGKSENIATAPVGDRVKIRDARLSGAVIELDVTQQGPGDAACCPTQQLTRRWSLLNGELEELGEEQAR